MRLYIVAKDEKTTKFVSSITKPKDFNHIKKQRGKMKKIIFILAFCGLVIANPLEFETLSGNFVQDVKSEGSKITYSGNFMANKEAALWNYKTPTLKNIFFNAQKVVVVEPELEQAIFTTLKDTPNFTDILASAKKNANGEYEATFDDTKYFIKLKNNLPISINYKDKLDNEVMITLSNVKKNEPIDQNIFTPVIPADFDIVTQ